MTDLANPRRRREKRKYGYEDVDEQNVPRKSKWAGPHGTVRSSSPTAGWKEPASGPGPENHCEEVNVL